MIIVIYYFNLTLVPSAEPKWRWAERGCRRRAWGRCPTPALSFSRRGPVVAQGLVSGTGPRSSWDAGGYHSGVASPTGAVLVLPEHHASIGMGTLEPFEGRHHSLHLDSGCLKGLSPCMVRARCPQPAARCSSSGDACSWSSTFLLLLLFICWYRSSNRCPSVSRGTRRGTCGCFKGHCTHWYYLDCK